MKMPHGLDMKDKIKHRARVILLGHLGQSTEFCPRSPDPEAAALELVTLEGADDFRRLELGERDVVITGVDSLKIDILDVLERAHGQAQPAAVLLVVGLDELDRLAQARERGLNAYVLQVEEPYFSQLLNQEVQQLVERGFEPLIEVEGSEVPTTQFWGFFDSVPIPVKILSERGQILQANEAMQEFFGREADELVGRPIFDFMHPDEVDRAKSELGELISKGRPRAAEAMIYSTYSLADRGYIKSDGTVEWGDLYLMPLWSDAETVIHLVGLMVDITDRKRAKFDLERREQRERAILKTAIDGILIVATDGTISSVNQAAESLFSEQAAVMEGRNIQDYLVDEDWAHLTAAIQNDDKGPHRREMTGLRGGEERFPLEFGLSEVPLDGEEKAFAVLVRDLTERVNYLEKLRRSERMEAVGHLASGIAHNFNNLLMIINSHVYLLQNHKVTDDAKEQSLQRIVAAIEKGKRLTDQLAALKPSPMTETKIVQLNEVVTEVTDLTKNVMGADIRLESELSEDLWVVEANVAQLEQVVLNLIINARDAMPTGGVLHIATGNLTVEPIPGDSLPDNIEQVPNEQFDLEPGKYVCLQVSDTGVGIPEESRAKIFDPYFTTKDSSMGMGLTTVANTARSHGGVIDVQSREERTTFSLCLPAAHGEVSNVDEKPEQVSESSLSDKVVLLVDDEDDIRDALSSVLERDMQVLSAGDGKEALHIVEEADGRIDLMITDLVMPGMSGVELARRLTRIYPNLPVIYISGHASNVLERKEITPDQVFITKPFDIQTLKSQIRRMLIAE